MTVVAFTFHHYDEQPPSQCFRGQWRDSKEACESIRGCFHEHLETMDLETLAWESFEWNPTYKFHNEHLQVDGKFQWDVQGKMVESRAWLTPDRSYNQDLPIVELKWTGSGSGYAVIREGGLDIGHGSRLMECGSWEKIRT
jgi:hypothetical protein